MKNIENKKPTKHPKLNNQNVRKTEEDYLKTIKEIADKIAKYNNGVINKSLYKYKEGKKLVYNINKYLELNSEENVGVEGCIDFLQDLGYKICKATIDDVREYLEKKGLNKDYHRNDLYLLKTKLKSFSNTLNMSIDDMLSSLGYKLVVIDKDYYKKKIIDYYPKYKDIIDNDSTSKEYRHLLNLCKRYNPDQTRQETLIELNLVGKDYAINEEHYKKRIIEFYNENKDIILEGSTSKEYRHLYYLCKRYSPKNNIKQTLTELRLED